MTNHEIDLQIDSQNFSIAYDEIHAIIRQLDYAANSADNIKALSYLENARLLLNRTKIKIENNRIYDCTRTN